jgi:hypothetical protein
MPKGRTHKIFDPSISASQHLFCLRLQLLKEENHPKLMFSCLKGQAPKDVPHYYA